MVAMKIAIVEDECALADELAALLYQMQERDVTWYESGEAFLFACEESIFDLVFMDIQMKNMNGLDTARTLRRNDKNVCIVFLSNDPSFVFEGYEVDAIRYWLKPVDTMKLRELLDSLQRPRAYLIWNVGSEIRKLYHDEIQYLESDGHYVLCHLQDDILRMKAGFKDICDQLPDDFIMTHRSYCVNMNHVNALVQDGCRMDNGDLAAISRTMKAKVQDAMMRRCMEDLSWNS